MKIDSQWLVFAKAKITAVTRAAVPTLRAHFS
jgi:hypothetical protein